VGSLPSAGGVFPWYWPVANLSLQFASIASDLHGINNEGNWIHERGSAKPSTAEDYPTFIVVMCSLLYTVSSVDHIAIQLMRIFRIGDGVIIIFQRIFLGTMKVKIETTILYLPKLVKPIKRTSTWDFMRFSIYKCYSKSNAFFLWIWTWIQSQFWTLHLYSR